VRGKVIDRLLNALYEIIDTLAINNMSLCLEVLGHTDCEALILGSLIQNLHKNGLWPRKDPKTIHMSVGELSNTLRNMAIRSANSSYPGYKCGKTAFKDMIQRQLDVIPNPILGSHLRHMEAQNGGGN
jgi:hypothetical protein